MGQQLLRWFIIYILGIKTEWLNSMSRVINPANNSTRIRTVVYLTWRPVFFILCYIRPISDICWSYFNLTLSFFIQKKKRCHWCSYGSNPQASRRASRVWHFSEFPHLHQTRYQYGPASHCPNCCWEPLAFFILYRKWYSITWRYNMTS